MTFKYGDIISYSGGRASVIEQRGNILVVEVLGQARTDKRFLELDTRTSKVNLVEKASIKELIRRR